MRKADRHGLYNAYMVPASFCLYGDHILAATVVELDAKFIDLDLSHSFDGRPEMVLKTIGREAEERVNQTIVPYDRRQGLFVVESIATN